MWQPADSTSSTLLERLLHDNNAAWKELDDRYRDIMVGFAERLGLNAHEAADVAQETLIAVYEGYSNGRYDRSRGRLRKWVIGIAKNRVGDLKRERARHARRLGLPFDERLPSDAQIDAIWDDEIQRNILRRALAELPQAGRLKPNTIKAFVLVALENRSPAEVAQELGMTVEAVYMAKHHCTKHVRRIAESLEAEYERDEL